MEFLRNSDADGQPRISRSVSSEQEASSVKLVAEVEVLISLTLLAACNASRANSLSFDGS